MNYLMSEHVEFLSEGYKLHGILTCNGSTNKSGVVLLHPHPLYGGDMENHVLTTLEQVFREQKIATLRFNFRGTPSSPQGYSGISGAVIDAMNAIMFLESHANVNDVGLVGYSFGASTALRLALIKPPSFLISLSASRALISEGGFDIRQLSNIECPVLLFHGTSDQMIPYSDLKKLAKIIKVEPGNCVFLEQEGHFYLRTMSLVASTTYAFIKNLYHR